ncbi:dipeptidase 1 isoform X5 [Chelonus insularis]|nr:dipeptidase 1 isoform X5 [Chelonus insularis]XP_034938116.1 dipeptidase 1 isoform X5 [Chelonus insularis]
MVAAQFWSAYVPCSSQHLDSVQLALEQIDLIRRLVNKHPKNMILVTTSEGIKKAHGEGRLASLIGVEGGHAISTSLAVLRMLYELGARYLTLTHTCNTPWADCSTTDEPGQVPHVGGLSNFGKSIIVEMNRLGMMVDLSHVSVPTMLDAMDVSRAPVIFSHSSAHAICNSSRNVPDHALQLLARSGGIVMISFYPHFISCSERSTLKDVVAHINHVRKVAGIDHVGIGAGYDGINLTPTGLEDVSKYPELFAELLTNGWSEQDVQKLAGLNLIRVFEIVEQVRDRMAAEGIEPLEDEISSEDIIGRDYCRYNLKQELMTP